MLDMDEALTPYIMNYKLNLFDYHEYRDFSMFTTENRELFEILSCAKSEKKLEELVRKNSERYIALSYDAAQTICDIAGIDIILVKEVKEDGRGDGHIRDSACGKSCMHEIKGSAVS